MKPLAVISGSMLLMSLSLTVQAEPITANNWFNHPDIVTIRGIFNSIQNAKQAGQLNKKSRIFEYCQPHADGERHLYSNPKGIVQLYTFAGGSDDSAVQTDLYYDTKSRLRFAFVRASAVNNTTYEYRIYFSSRGKKIWEERKQLSGEGYTFPEHWPLNQLPQKPVKAFNADHPCLEQS